MNPIGSVETIGRFEAHTLPDGSVVYFDDDKHAYYSEIKPSKSAKGGYSFVRGSRLPGVSTIAKFLDPPGDGLLHWAAKLDQEGIAECAARDLEAQADLTWLAVVDRIRERLREEEATWSHVRDRAATRGTNVHEFAIGELAAGRVPNLSDFTPEERPFGQAAIAWWRERQPEVIAAEQVTASFSHGFAGRFDLLCVFDAATVLVDAKTRDKGQVRVTDFVQLSGYEAANVECGIDGSDTQLALILMPDGTFREEWNVTEGLDFFAALNAYMANKKTAKRMQEAGKRREEEVAA